MAQKQIKAELTCPVCMELYRLPRRLPCGHAYCHQCIANLLAHNTWSSRNLMCPECRETVRLDYVLGIEALPLDFKLSRLVEIMGFLETNDSSNSDENELPHVTESQDPVDSTTIQQSQPSPPLPPALSIPASATPSPHLPTSSATSNTATTTAVYFDGDGLFPATEIDNSFPPPPPPVSSTPTVPLPFPASSMLDEVALSFELTDFSLPRNEFDDYLDTLTYPQLWREAEIVLNDLVDSFRTRRQREPQQQRYPSVSPTLSDVTSRPLSSLSSSSLEEGGNRPLFSSSESEAADDAGCATADKVKSDPQAKPNSESRPNVNAKTSSSVDDQDIALNTSRANNAQRSNQGGEIQLNDDTISIPEEKVEEGHTHRHSSDSVNCFVSVGAAGDGNNHSSDDRRLPGYENNTENPDHPSPSVPQWRGVSSTLLRLGDILTGNSSPEDDRLGYSADIESDEERDVHQQNSGSLGFLKYSQGLASQNRSPGLETNIRRIDPTLLNSDIFLDAVLGACENRQHSRNNTIETSNQSETEREIVWNSSTKTSDAFKSKYQKLKKKVVNLFRDSFSSSESSDEDEVEQEQERKPPSIPQKKLEREKRKWRMTRRLMSLILSDDGSSSSDNNASEEKRAEEITEKSFEEQMEKEKDISMDWLSDDSSDGFFGFWKKSKKAGLVRKNDKDSRNLSKKGDEEIASVIPEKRPVECLNAAGQSSLKKEDRGGETSPQTQGAEGVDKRELKSTNHKTANEKRVTPTHTEPNFNFDLKSRRSPQENNFPVPYIPPFSSHYDNDKVGNANPTQLSGTTTTINSTPSCLFDPPREATLYDNILPLPVKQIASISTKPVQNKITHSKSNTRQKLPHNTEASRPHVALEGGTESSRSNVSQSDAMINWRQRCRNTAKDSLRKSGNNQIIAAEMLRRLCRQQYDNDNNSATCRPELENLKTGFENQQGETPRPDTVIRYECLYSDESMDRLQLDLNLSPTNIRGQVGIQRDSGAEIENLKEDGCVQARADRMSSIGATGQPMMSLYDNLMEGGESRCHMHMLTGMRSDPGSGLRERDGQRGDKVIGQVGHQEIRTVGDTSGLEQNTARRLSDSDVMLNEMSRQQNPQCQNVAATTTDVLPPSEATNVSKTDGQDGGCDDNNNDNDKDRQNGDMCGGRMNRNNNDNSDEDDNFLEADPSSAMLKSTKKTKSRFRKFISSLMWVSSSSDDDDDYAQYQNSKSTSFNSNSFNSW